MFQTTVSKLYPQPVFAYYHRFVSVSWLNLLKAQVLLIYFFLKTRKKGAADPHFTLYGTYQCIVAERALRGGKIKTETNDCFDICL